MKNFKHIIFYSLLSVSLLAIIPGCKGATIDHSYPMEPEDERRAKRGKLTGDEGISLGGGKKKKEGNYSGPSIGVNSYIWRATLDTVAFMPLASADPFGGVIITEWYEDPEAAGERFKLNISILDTQLHSNAVKVSVFKQALDESNNWRDAAVDPAIASDLENKILTRARELRVKNL